MEELSAVFEKEWCRSLAGAGVPYETRLDGGEPVGVLLRAAEESGADMVVVGCRGHRRLVDVPLGSTAHQVIMRSPRPVLVVPLAEPAG
jgi:nucleotide-binding universal stress UspA family protein